MANQNSPANGYGITGFILSIIAVVLSFIKVNTTFVDAYSWIVWAVWCVAVFLCAVGLFKRPKTLAVAGLIICVAAICIMYFVAETVAPI